MIRRPERWSWATAPFLKTYRPSTRNTGRAREELMAVPKRRVSKSRKRMRRAHLALSRPFAVKCSRCDSRKLPHTICEVCGYYRGRPVIAIEEV